MTASSSVRVTSRLATMVPGCGPCGMPRGCSVNDASSTPAAAAEPAADVVQHLVGLHVRVGVRHLDRLGVRVEHPRGERADDEPGRLERLVDRRRLVDRAGDRLEVVGVERERVDHPVPADHVERVT